jgi:hypothetical protein
MKSSGVPKAYWSPLFSWKVQKLDWNSANFKVLLIHQHPCFFSTEFLLLKSEQLHIDSSSSCFSEFFSRPLFSTWHNIILKKERKKKERKKERNKENKKERKKEERKKEERKKERKKARKKERKKNRKKERKNVFCSSHDTFLHIFWQQAQYICQPICNIAMLFSKICEYTVYRVWALERLKTLFSDLYRFNVGITKISKRRRVAGYGRRPCIIPDTEWVQSQFYCW